RAVLVPNHTCVQQHGAVAHVREVVLNLEAVHRRMFGNDRLEKQPEGWNVPLPATQIEQDASLSVLRVDLEKLVEAAAGCQHPEAVVEHHKGLGQGIDDR